MDATQYPDLGTTDCDVDHPFGPYLAVDVVRTQMPSKSAARHTLEPRGA